VLIMSMPYARALAWSVNTSTEVSPLLAPVQSATG
jgi:hypothetical protein